MKFLTYFVGFLLIGSGLIWINHNFDLVIIEIPDMRSIWPLALIFIGIAVLKIPEILRNISSAIAGLVLAISLISSIVHTNDKLDNFKFRVEEKLEEELNEEEYSIF